MNTIKNMRSYIAFAVCFCCMTLLSLQTFAQTNNTNTETTLQDNEGGFEKPVIMYSGTPRQYTIADIQVEGGGDYDDYVLIGLSGLAVGENIRVPGDDITKVLKRYWRHGLFSDVKITAEKIKGNKIWLKIWLKQRPRISKINYHGIKKSDREDLQLKLGLVEGSQITPNLMNRAKILIKNHYDEKGYKNAEVIINQKEDKSRSGYEIVDIDIDRKDRVKVKHIYITGNKALSDRKIKRTMKKTNEKGKLLNLFRTKKFVQEEYEKDKDLVLSKYNSLGYRDARIVTDSVTKYDDKSVDVYLNIEEGRKYYLRNISWVGNTKYTVDELAHILKMRKGDVYNQKLLDERLTSDDDAIGNLYYNNGYLFYNLQPVEVNIDGDSIDLEMRIYEGQPAKINKVTISGNDNVYENVVRRELRVKPGQLFSKEDIMRSAREIAQMGHFDPEKVQPDITPNPEDGTVDIGWPLVSKSNDQIEFSAGWGQTGVIGKLSLKFTNFSMTNLFHPGKNHRGILPRGDGQTMTISGQTNAKYYQSYSISFMDPWFGGKRPNSFSVSAFYSRQTDINSSYYSSNAYNSYYNNYNSGYGGYGSYGRNNNNYENYYDPNKSIQMYGLSIGWGKRLTWPDDYFTLSTELAYQHYIMKDWLYFPVTNGECNKVSIGITLARNSTDNPIFPRRGSNVSFSVNMTPPYSLFDGVDYSKYNPYNTSDMNKMHKWIEYHKWKFKSNTFTSLTSGSKCLVLRTRADFGLLGSYDRYKNSPFETFDVGGDGMTGYSSYATESVGLRGYDNSSLTSTLPGRQGYAYSRMTLELRYPLMLETSTTIYALAFLEGGNAWGSISDFNPFEMKRSAGIGVRIFLPMIGMMGIDWAYGFDDVNGSDQYSGSQFHFILGQEF